MKSILRCILVFFVLFSTIDLSIINLSKIFCFDIKTTTSISEIIEIECDLLQQTTKVVKNICNNIAKDVELLLVTPKSNNVFFDIDKIERRIGVDNFFNYIKFVLTAFLSTISYVVNNTQLILFFFGFIFLFMLKYLGLLFTFDGIIISNSYNKAYSI